MIFLRKFAVALYHIIRFYPIWSKLKKKNFLFLCHVTDMGETVNGELYSKLLDPIFEQLKKRDHSCLHITRDLSPNGDKTFNNSISYNQLRLFYSEWWWLKRNFLKIFNFILPKRYNHTISDDLDIDFYNSIITKSKVQAIFCISAFSKLCEISTLRGVKIIEVLHGIGYTLPLPPNFDESLPKEQLPDIILSFDDVSTKTFSILSEKNKLMVRQIENYWYKMFKEGRIPEEWKSSLDTKQYKKTILYSLQWGYDHDHEHFEGILDNGIMPDSILELIKRTENDILWLLRLHPIQLRSKKYESHRLFIKELTEKRSNVEYQLSSTLPLPSVLQIADLHISMISMTTYDAAYFGLKSLIMCPSLDTIYSSMFLDLQSRGYAKKVNYKEIDEILKFINEANKIEPLKNENQQVSIIDVLKEFDLIKTD